MAYIGRQLARGENKLFDDISSSFNGSTTTFNLTVSSVATATATPYQLFVSLGGVMQKPNTDFTTAGNQITFTTAPAAGLSCWIMMQGDTIDQAAIPDASVTPSKISGTNFAFSGDLRLKDADGSHYVGFASPTTVSTNKVWTLPAADGSASQYLQTNGSGVLTWASVTIGGASGIDFNDNVKARWGTGNDLEIFHNSSNSVINDAGTGDLLLQVGGSTKATVSSTGLAVTGALTVSTNATITGDLTVSGTTTTINTQTLDVEDKNVVIGKVSSPSDTTADGGGWTLKGATDKTFNWVNATDAWTSSEHIHLLDNKKLLVGTDSDLEIFHNGSHSLLNDSGTGNIRFQLGGSTKLEVQAGGINVTGAINVDGSPLETAPEITATATGAISNQAPVVVRSDGNIEAISGTIEAKGTITDFDSTTGVYIMPVRVLYDPDINKVVIFYVRYQSGDPYFYSMICGINSNNTISLGTQKQIPTTDSNNRIGGGQSSDNATACYNTAVNKYMIAYRGQDNRMHTAHGTVQSNHTDITWSGGDNHGASEFWQPNHVRMEYSPDDGSAQLVWRRSSNAYIYRVNCQYTASSTKLHLQNSPTAIVSQSSSNVEITYDTNVNRYMVGYKNDSGTAYGRIVTTNAGGGDTQGPYNFASGDTGGNKAIFVPSENKSIICYSRSTATGLFAKVVTHASNGSITYGAEVAIDTTGGASYITSDLDATNNKVLVSWYNGSTGIRYASSGKISGTTTTWTPRFTVDNGAGHAAIGWNTNDEKSLIASRDGTGSDHGKAQTYIPSATNLTTENFIGFAKAAIGSGATGAVKVVGNTTTQSSLTPGQLYYVQSDGSLGLDPVTDLSVPAGRALNSTTLLIKG